MMELSCRSINKSSTSLVEVNERGTTVSRGNAIFLKGPHLKSESGLLAVVIRVDRCLFLTETVPQRRAGLSSS